MTSLKGQHARPKRTLAATETEQPPPQKRRKNTTTSPPPSFTSLPDEIILNCLARISRTHYRLLSLVFKTIGSLLSSPELYAVRSEIGNTEPCLYICPELPTTYDRWYTLDQTLLTDGPIKDVFSFSHITRPTFSASPPPQNPTTLAVGFEIYQMGGTIDGGKRRKRPSSAVRVLDCRTHTWRDAPDMTVPRKGAQSAFIDGKIYVVGGTEKSQNRAECFDLKSQTWKLLPNLSDYDAEVRLCRGEIYATNKHKHYAYDSKQERWKEVLEFGFGPGDGTSGPWCVIENVTFSNFRGKLSWYDTERRNWIDVKGLEYKSGTTIQLANHGRQILLLREEPQKKETVCCSKRRETGKHRNQRIRSLVSSMAWKGQEHRNQGIRCEVIKLEKRIGSSGLEICWKIEWSKYVLTVPKSYDFLSCIITL